MSTFYRINELIKKTLLTKFNECTVLLPPTILYSQFYRLQIEHDNIMEKVHNTSYISNRCNRLQHENNLNLTWKKELLISPWAFCTFSFTSSHESSMVCVFASSFYAANDDIMNISQIGYSRI